MARRFCFAPVLFVTLWACGGTVETQPSKQTGGSGGASGSGGSSVGGGATGGTAQGGTSGASGVGGTGGVAGSSGVGGTGVGPWPECQAPGTECKVFSDCCTCTAYSPTEPPPPSCLADCDVDACTAIGWSSEQPPACELGQCIVGMDCDLTHAFCNALPPDCSPGTAPTVVDGCWGGCVTSTQCLTISSCDFCTGPGQLCVNHQVNNAEFHCVDVPPACAGDLTESRLCPLLCPNWNFCNMQEGRVQCDYI